MPADDTIVAVIEAVAESDGVELSEMDFILSDHIDPEVLEKLGIWKAESGNLRFVSPTTTYGSHTMVRYLWMA